MLRFIFKPFKRWAFYKAKKYTLHYIEIYNKKYIIKFLNKEKKFANLKNNHNLILLIDTLNNYYLINIIHNLNDHTINNINNIINNYLIINSNILDIYNYIFIIKFSSYIYELYQINKKDIGLDHSKVREYWLKRGPRIFLTSTFFIILNYILYSYFKDIDYNTQLYLIIINIIALISSFYMLYYRLPDSIESAIARTTHDHYVKYKNNFIL
tara:strand:+ start:843 stop:1478 length:636 start_codon:yes stop_codon:yes gene_type:complete